MSEIENTTEQMREQGHRLGFLLDAMATGDASAPIERQERAGQSQFVHSDRMPAKLDKAAFEALGFTFGEPDPHDPLFMPATLPAGWQREGSDHAMWSYITDEHGRRRVSVFYKAAFYDRDAFANINSLAHYVRSVLYEGGELAFDDQWATRETVAAALTELQEREAGEIARFREVGMDEAAERHEAELHATTEALKGLSA